MRKSRRELEIFSLSFLDCICCGFGALILLFVLSKFGAPVIMEEIREDLEGEILRLEQTLHELRGDTEVLNRRLKSKEEQLSEEKLKLARLQGDLSRIEGEFTASKQNSEVQGIIEGKLAKALQELTEEMKRLQRDMPRQVSSSVGGIPVDSEYIVFIIDTS
ncbi:MAG: VWA domain-containing protein, partial [Deltaproteobacteria bacterium]|nr:VWA domain-containing protein [Deltaproteobacteria bacterium]